MVRQRVRIRFRKQGDLRFLGHRDLARSLERLFRRAGLRLRRSQGYHPKPKISFPSALSVGIEGLDEIVELELVKTVPEDQLLMQLNACAVPGLEFLTIETLAPKQSKAKLQNTTYRLYVPEKHLRQTATLIDRFLAASSVSYRRPDKNASGKNASGKNASGKSASGKNASGKSASQKTVSVDIRPLVDSLRLTRDQLEMRLTVGRVQGVGVRDILSVLGLAGVEADGGVLARTRVEIAS